MRKWIGVCGLGCILLIALLGVMVYPVRAQELAVVRAVLFFQPGCSHCEYVMTEVLPPLREQYGARLVIAELDRSKPRREPVFQEMLAQFQPELQGVPALVIGDRLLVGSQEIPEELPGLIEAKLAEGGVDWPDLPGLTDVLAEMGPELSDQVVFSVRDTFARDPLGNGVSVAVLVGLVVAFVAVLQSHRWHAAFAGRFMPWGVFVVLLVGLVVAGYLAYVEVTQTEAVCGPIGDCNAVQQSKYALIFGFLPMGVFGVLGYVVIFASYAYAHWIKGPGHVYVPALTFILALFGLAFSIYLTFLEPFVIGATCAWCLASALCMMLLTLLLADSGWTAIDAWNKDAWRRKANRHRRRKKRSRK